MINTSKRPKILLLFIIAGIFFPAMLFSQNCVIKGKITETGTNEPVPFVNIGIKDQHKGTSSDMNGSFELPVTCGEYIIVFSSIGYEKYTEKVNAKAGKPTVLNVTLKPTVHDLNTTVVSASKYEQKLEDATNSVEILKPAMLETKNILTLDKAVESVPGVAIVDNEPQIRGGSGYSSGLGSRVMILIDEIPILSPDAGRPVWDFLPVEDVEQIEVVKGASSVTYGSAALNGAINIRTAYPKDKPLTKVTMTSGIYSVPSKEYTKSWEGFNPIIIGASFIHAKRVNNIDYTVGGNFLSDPGYIGPPPGDNSGTYEKGAFNKHLRLNFGTRVRSVKVEGLTYGLNGNFMYTKDAQSYFWEDADTNIFRSYPGAITNFNQFQFYADPYVKYFNAKGGTHSFKNRVYYSNNGASNNQSTMSYSIYDEYQYSKTFKKTGFPTFNINAGVMNMYAYSHGSVFSGDFTAPGSKSSDNFAVYLQTDVKLLNRLTFAGGARWEYYKLSSYTDSKPIFRAGINLRATNFTYVRASFGQGFRFPSIGERYISTYSGNFGIYPNPDLKSETSWNTELGIKQLFKIKNFIGFLDVCGFWQEYANYIEFTAYLWGRNTDSTGKLDASKNLGYKFLNTADARVWGIDCALVGEGKFTKNLSMTFLAGYTFSRPTCLEPEKVFYTDSLSRHEFTYLNSSSDPRLNILKYRFEQLGKLDVDFTYKSISFGLSGKYYGFMYNIDKFFLENDRAGMFNTGIKEYRNDNHNGEFVFDTRISYELKKHFKFALLINNVFNNEYSLRPIFAQPPRVSSIQIVYKV